MVPPWNQECLLLSNQERSWAHMDLPLYGVSQVLVIFEGPCNFDIFWFPDLKLKHVCNGKPSTASTALHSMLTVLMNFENLACEVTQQRTMMSPLNMEGHLLLANHQQQEIKLTM